MRDTSAGRGGRRRGRGVRTGGLSAALVLLGLTAACASGPSDDELRERATSPAAEARRGQEERTMRTLIARLDAVEGLEHLGTTLTDRCARPGGGSLFEGDRSPHALTCGMTAAARFEVRGEITEVLRGIRAADVAAWGPRDDAGRDVPGAAGTVSYAIAYHRDRGRYPDGTAMPGPALQARGARIDWDRPDMPVPNRIGPPAPCLSSPAEAIYDRCTTVPGAAPTGKTVLLLTLGDSGSTAYEYVTVPRGD
ncbi:hypothetical protein [Streptomyces sp. NPDC003327]